MASVIHFRRKLDSLVLEEVKRQAEQSWFSSQTMPTEVVDALVAEVERLRGEVHHEMTPVRTAVAYTTLDLRFTYIEGGTPKPGIAVLGAWTNGDEFHVAPSVWDGSEQRWLDHDNSFASNDDHYLYAWAEWPEAPPL